MPSITAVPAAATTNQVVRIVAHGRGVPLLGRYPVGNGVSTYRQRCFWRSDEDLIR